MAGGLSQHLLSRRPFLLIFLPGRRGSTPKRESARLIAGVCQLLPRRHRSTHTRRQKRDGARVRQLDQLVWTGR